MRSRIRKVQKTGLVSGPRRADDVERFFREEVRAVLSRFFLHIGVVQNVRAIVPVPVDKGPA